MKWRIRWRSQLKFVVLWFPMMFLLRTLYFIVINDEEDYLNEVLHNENTSIIFPITETKFNIARLQIFHGAGNAMEPGLLVIIVKIGRL